MLACGVFWAYIIGALVDAVASLGTLNKEYVSKMNEANQMVRDFTSKSLPGTKSGSLVETDVSKRVRRFITEQRDRATTKTMESSSAETLMDKYPTLKCISPELRKICALHLACSFVESVPYLSSKYLSPDDQAHVVLNSIQMEFAAGEKFTAHETFGRGILVFIRGLGVASRQRSPKQFYLKRSYANCPIDDNEVLVDENFFENEQLAIYFAVFSKVLFIPRSVIIEILAKNEKAWKQCARWKYFTASFILKSLAHRKNTAESV